MAGNLPLFGPFNILKSINFSGAPEPIDVLALQVSIQRVPPLDKAVFTYGIPAITVVSYWGVPNTEESWDATQAVPLAYNSGGTPEDQAAYEALQGPGTLVPMYGKQVITSNMAGANWLWSQGPGCQSGAISTKDTYKVRGYLFYNLTAIKKVQKGGLLQLIVSMSACSGSTYEVVAEALSQMTSVWYGAANTLTTNGGVTVEPGGSMPWTGKDMLYWAQGIGTPDTDATDSLTPTVTVNVDLTAADYSITMANSGFGGTSPNTFAYTSGAGPD